LHPTPTTLLTCDGCGQPASPEHIARRLQRLEWMTRYRPIHIGTLLLGGVSPQADGDFLYAGKFEGEAGRLLEAVEISPAGKAPEPVLSEFQRGGFFLAHLLECPLAASAPGQALLESLLAQQLAHITARVRRSLKPKRVVLISALLAPLTSKLSSADLGCPMILDNGKPFDLSSSNFSGVLQRLRKAITAPAAGM